MKFTTNNEYILEFDVEESKLYMRMLYHDDYEELIPFKMTLKMTEGMVIKFKAFIQNPTMDNEPEDIRKFRTFLWDKLINIKVN